MANTAVSLSQCKEALRMIRKRAGVAMLVALLPLMACVGAEPPPPAPTAQWQRIGLSGSGAMFAPAISPVDPQRMMVNCDMSGAYVTNDGGLHWQMIHQAQLRSN